ncbi:MAG: cell division protein FtsL [Burkholderiaceae bacterium]|jgi:cell division protein FtsL|nr:MAG: cell division protein FtsL [Burkholderiaceae bacterium]
MRLALVLALILMATGMAVVKVSHRARNLVIELEKAEDQERQLAADHERLVVERRQAATPLKVEQVARDRLKMRTATPAITQYVAPPMLRASEARP